jgi:Zn-dependent protease with chaperone function
LKGEFRQPLVPFWNTAPHTRSFSGLFLREPVARLMPQRSPPEANMSIVLADLDSRALRPRDEGPIRVHRWPSEVPLVVLTALVSVGIWALAAITIIGLVYAVMLGVFFFVMHVSFVAHVRGSGVRLGPDQFPDLYAAVERLSARMELRPVPETYMMQAGGTLNAFAAKFLRSNIVVLYSDLLEACDDDDAARDMIIAHELGHIHAGHLQWTWFLIPGSLVPFLGTALSRAREYTCDRYGLAGSGRRESALVGLAILAAGGKHGPRVNREAMVRQREQLNTGWMRIGEWLSTHPPLANRMAALDPALDAMAGTTTVGTVRAIAILLVACAAPVVATMLAFAAIIGAASKLAGAAPQTSTGGGAAPDFAATLTDPGSGRSIVGQQQQPAPAVDVEQELTAIRVRMDLETLANVVEREKMEGFSVTTTDALYAKLAERSPGTPEPRDPFDGQRFAFEPHGDFYVLRSAGPDKVRGTGDDIVRDSRRK